MNKQEIILIISVLINILLLIVLKVNFRENKFLRVAYKSRVRACDEVWRKYVRTVKSFCKESMERFDKLIEIEKENKELKTKLIELENKGGK